MEKLELIIGNPFFAALFGWLAWNVIMFRIDKDSFDDRELDFPLFTYIRKHWDNWLSSLVMIPILLYLGYYKMDIGLVEVEDLKWNDLYYLASGFATELVITAWKKWKNK